MYFEDRLHAAAELAEALDGDLDVVLVRKLGAPWNPELAVGAVGESGWTYISEYARALHIDESYLARAPARPHARPRHHRRRRTTWTPRRSRCVT
jgi:putative phosphoribosyl transferase